MPEQQIELKVPSVGESISTVEIGSWLVEEGQAVAADTSLASLETDKVTVDLQAPAAGVLLKRLKQQGETAAVGEVVAVFAPGAVAPANGAAPPEAPPPAPLPADRVRESRPELETRVMPAAARLLEESGVSSEAVTATGPGGRLLKEDVQAHLEAAPPPAPSEPRPPAQSQGETAAGSAPTTRIAAPAPQQAGRAEELVPMTSIRRRIAERLVQAQQTSAQLTTFNEVDLARVMELRREYQDAFVKRHGVKLGFMSFFVRAAIEALKEIPQLNAEIRGDHVAYRHYYDIGIAVSTPRGLVVPVLRSAERMGLAEIEKSIEDFAKRARENRLRLEELVGGTFTISNGGVFGSLLSTPILNPPQSGVLGMHTIQERPVALSGQVVIRPMMYIALTYDHRLVDGREAVTFLKRVKEAVEQPARILLEV